MIGASKSRNMVDEVVVFLHIPKTAGTSVRRLLELNFDPSDRVEVYQNERFTAEEILKQKLEQRDRQPKLIVGHISVHLIRKLPWPVRTVTFLRDPLQLCFSRMRHWQRSGQAKHLQELSRFRDINHHLEMCATNVMARRLGVSEKLARHKPYVALELALTTIEEEFAFVGLAERFEQDTQRLAEVLKLTDYQVFNENVAPPAYSDAGDQYHGASPAAIRTFQERNWVDYQLYNWVKSTDSAKKALWQNYVHCRSLLQGGFRRSRVSLPVARQCAHSTFTPLRNSKRHGIEMAGANKSRNMVDEVVVFLHIPKTAGTSVRRLLELNFDPADRLELYELYGNGKLKPEEIIKQKLEQQVRPPKLIVGHLSIDLIRLMPWPVRNITFLREPLDLCFSRMLHLRRSPKEIHKKQWCRYRDVDHYLETFAPNAMSMRMGIPVDLMSRNPQAALKLAYSTIAEKFFFIGLAERFEQDARRLTEKLGLKTFQLFKENVRQDSGDEANDPYYGASEAAVRVFQQRNWLDYQIYDWVKEGMRGLVGRELTRGKKLVSHCLSQTANWFTGNHSATTLPIGAARQSEQEKRAA